MSDCFICERINDNEIIYKHKGIVILDDGFPVTEGHALIVPVRHISNYFHLKQKELKQIHKTIYLYCEHMSSLDIGIDGWNIGWNVGGSAGQTVEHAHCHLIPRRTGDCENPVGGVRNVIPEMGDYLK